MNELHKPIKSRRPVLRYRRFFCLRLLLARVKELDRLFTRIYEDNDSGKISDERFAKMSLDYEDKQHGLTARVKSLKAELAKTAADL